MQIAKIVAKFMKTKNSLCTPQIDLNILNLLLDAESSPDIFPTFLNTSYMMNAKIYITGQRFGRITCSNIFKNK